MFSMPKILKKKWEGGCWECGFVVKNRNKNARYCSNKCKYKSSRDRNYKNNPNYYKDYRRKNKLKVKIYGKKSDLRQKFGITLDFFNKMLGKQGGLCAICHKENSIPGRSLAVDHCHKTRKVRGLLCFKCNRALGGFDDSIKLLSNAITYLCENG